MASSTAAPVRVHGRYAPAACACAAKAVALLCWRNMRSAVALAARAPAVAQVSIKGCSGKVSDSHSDTWNASRAARGIGCCKGGWARAWAEWGERARGGGRYTGRGGGEVGGQGSPVRRGRCGCRQLGKRPRPRLPGLARARPGMLSAHRRPRTTGTKPRKGAPTPAVAPQPRHRSPPTCVTRGMPWLQGGHPKLGPSFLRWHPSLRPPLCSNSSPLPFTHAHAHHPSTQLRPPSGSSLLPFSRTSVASPIVDWKSRLSRLNWSPQSYVQYL